MRISYGLTVCDEEREIRELCKFLLDTIDSEDEVVIVYDNNRVTESILSYLKEIESPRCRSYPFDFKQNFLENKNFMNSKCTGDFIFQLDADEFPETDLVSSIKLVLEANDVDVLICPRKNIVVGLTDEYVKKWGWTLHENKYVMWPDYQKRIYRNKSDIKWTGHPVHGMVEGYKTFAFLPAELNWAIIHTKQLARQIAQNERYSKIEQRRL